MITGNKGECSEIYTLFKLLGDRVIYSGNSSLNKIEELFYPIVKILREESETITDYEINKDLVIISSSNQEIIRIPVIKFLEKAKLLFEEIKNSTGSFSDSLKLKFLPKEPYAISIYQKLSEQFISDNWEVLEPYAQQIANYQRLSPEFREKYDLNRYINHRTNWLYWSDSEKATYIKECTKYELHIDDQGQYILAYKGVRANGSSKYNWQIQYEVSKTYEPVNNCNCDSDDGASSGLSAWYKQEALKYCNQKLLLVKIYLKDLGVIVKCDRRIRCRKLTVVEEVEI